MSTLNLNVPPYYDDYNPDSGYHQILFKPGYPVQARELTQTQTILQEQVRRFGDHVFKHGSVVTPGNTFAEIGVPYITLTSASNGTTIDYIDKIIVGNTNGVKAVVKKVVSSIGNDTTTLYINYVSGGMTNNVANGINEFVVAESIKIEGSLINATIATIGKGSLAFINKGVYYINGMFVSVAMQSVVLDKYGVNPSGHVLLKINQSVVDYTTDQTLLDPAQGSYNYAAPGADRLKINLELVTLPLNSLITSDYVELMRYNEGVLEEHSRYPKYNELAKSLAQRTVDESGDYVVSGFNTTISEHKREDINGGVYLDGDINKLVYTVAPGKAYISGFGVDTIANRYLEADKCLTTDHVKYDTANFKTSLGQFILITKPTGFFNTEIRQDLTLYSIQGGALLGTAKAIALDYYTADSTNYVICKLYITNLKINNPNNTLDSIGYITSASGAAIVVNEYKVPLNGRSFEEDDIVSFTYGATTRSAKVVFWNPLENKMYAYRHTSNATPLAGDSISNVAGISGTISSKSIVISAGTGGLVFQLPKGYTKTLKNANNVVDIRYTSFNRLVMAPNTASISSLTELVPIETGTFIAIDAATGILPNSEFTLSGGNRSVTRSVVGVSQVTIYCQTIKDDADTQLRTKTPTTVNNEIKAASASVSLNRVDVYEIVSIINNGIDIKNSYTLDNNSNDFSYEYSKLIINKGVSIPTGTLTITYKYFAHSAGDYFSADSYVQLGTDYLTSIPQYTSPSGVSYKLKDCLDFRASAGTTNHILVNDTIIETAVQRFMPRYDSICLDKSGKLSVLNGTPADNPKPPIVPNGLYELERVRLPAFSQNLTEATFMKVASTRYTMRDIAKIEERVARLEEFSTLTAVENAVVKLNVLDAKTGLDRFKTGYLVEEFVDPFQTTNVNTSDLKVSVNSTDGLFAKMEMMTIPMSVYSGLGYANTNGVLSLAYTEVPFAEVRTCSRVTNLNPFLVISWNGVMTLTPPNTRWVDILDKPEIFVNIGIQVDRTRWFGPNWAWEEPSRVAVNVGAPILSSAPSTLTTIVNGSAVSFIAPAPALHTN